MAIIWLNNYFILNFSGIFFIDELNIESIFSLVTFWISHFDRSGIFVNFKPENILHISVTFWVSQFDISGKDYNLLQQ